MSIYDIVGWPTISHDIRDHTRYRIRYVILGCLVRRHLSLHEGLDVQYCPCEHASQRSVLLFRPPPSQVSEHASIQDYLCHRHPRARGHHISCSYGPSCCPRESETYLFSKELVAYLETLIAFSCYYRADDSSMAGKMDMQYSRLIYYIVGWYTIS